MTDGFSNGTCIIWSKKFETNHGKNFGCPGNAINPNTTTSGHSTDVSLRTILPTLIKARSVRRNAAHAEPKKNAHGN
jgi:hypothetical protein